MSGKGKLEIKTIEEFKNQPEEYQTAVKKIVQSHAVNELYGSQVFDEPAIALAPTPYAKWLSCRVAMEEYGHHVRFAELGKALGIPERDLAPRHGRSSASSNWSATWPRSCRWRTSCNARSIRCVTSGA
jgi:ring-1,2-phenylacetyl-CoA epoxidase subunit PaaA